MCMYAYTYELISEITKSNYGYVVHQLIHSKHVHVFS